MYKTAFPMCPDERQALSGGNMGPSAFSEPKTDDMNSPSGGKDACG